MAFDISNNAPLARMHLNAGDDAADCKWIQVNGSEFLDEFYQAHTEHVLRAVDLFNDARGSDAAPMYSMIVFGVCIALIGIAYAAWKD